MYFMTDDKRHVVVPPSGDSGPYTVHLFTDDPDVPYGLGTAFQVDTLKDECSCAAMQGIACDHKSAVDEYAAFAAKQILEDAQPEPDVQTPPATASHNVKYLRRQLGMTQSHPARPIWGTDVTCSCGFTDVATEPRTKDDAKLIFRAHKEDATDTTPAPIYPTREGWLNEATRHIHQRAALLGLGDNPPATRVACGFTYGKGRRIGECWRKEQSGDGHFEIIVHNKLDNVLEVLAVLTHEIGHTFMNKDTAHKAAFQRWSKTMGLIAPYVASLPGPELTIWLTELAATLGTYPHAALDSAKRVREGGPKKQTNRWLKYVCEVDGCGWIVRAAKPDFQGICVSPMHFSADDPSNQVLGRFVPSFTVEVEVEEPE